MAGVAVVLVLLSLALEEGIAASVALRLTFTATLEKTVIEVGPTSLRQRSADRVAADASSLSLASAFTLPDGRTGTMITSYSDSPALYQIEPFFGADICYKFSAPAASNRTRAWREQLQTKILGTPAELLRKLTEVSAAEVDGQACTLYHAQQNTSVMDEALSICVGHDQQLLASNTTQVLKYAYTSQEVQILRIFRNYSAMVDPTFVNPPTACLDLTGGLERLPDESLVNDPERVADTQAAAAGFWHAAPSPVFEGVSMEQARREKLGTKMGALRLPLAPRLITGEPLPPAFDAREEWPRCGSVGRIRNQGNCGSCWAFGASEAFADRVCIAGGARDLTLATEYMVDCDRRNEGCQGGYLDDAWRFLQEVGVPDEACSPYEHCSYPAAESCRGPGALQVPPSPGVCPTRCADGAMPRLLRATSAYAVARPGDVAAMQREILTRGPIEAAFFVFSDFMHYRNGTYFRTVAGAGPVGGHAVRMLGWGVDAAGVPYWLAANSWSQEWGMKGFFHIRRGTNECGIESTPAAGEYAMTSPAKNLVV